MTARLFVALVLLLFCSMGNSPASAIETPNAPLHPGLADGAGIWMNLWSYPDGDVEAYCKNLHRHGVRNLFLQTSRSNTPALKDHAKLGALIEACHKHKIRVLAWSFAELIDPVADAQKLVDAAKFRTPRGQTFDGIAPNLEKELGLVKVQKYTEHLRKSLGKTYPMVAVVFSPLNKSPQVARTPWKYFSDNYDVIAPMSYWNSKYAVLEPYSYTRDTINKVRELCGRPDVEIHVIGDGMKTHPPEIKKFFEACRDTAVTSASLYPFHKVTPEQYECLSSYFEYFPTNSRYRMAAFHRLMESGMFSSGCSSPASALNRGDFYRLLGARLTGSTSLSADRAATLLIGYGVVPANHKEAIMRSSVYLNEPMGRKEAYVLVARVLEAQTRAQSMGLKFDGKHPVNLVSSRQNKKGEWFALPALAENVHQDKRSHLSYLDAAEIMLGVSGVR